MDRRIRPIAALTLVAGAGIAVALTGRPADRNTAGRSTESPETSRDVRQLPATPRPLQRLDPQTLQERALDGLPTAYITLLSIIQGLALALLATRLHDAGMDELLRHRAQTAAYLVCLATIVTVFYMYVWFVVIVRWPPTLLDTLVPVVLGAAQAALIETAENPHHWVVSLAAMQFAGAGAFMHSHSRATREMFGNGAAGGQVRAATTHRLIDGLLSGMAASLFVGGVAICLVLYVARDASPARWYPIAVALAGVAGAMVLAMWTASELVLKRIFEMHGLAYYRPPRPARG